ncbi:hypothetical protein CCR94_14270 [Rhodoblastus sphagnicola]|uniref:Uncharacterized protein n=1 Tax=Rhodoblastus sphagnicola TaxID=333368 RepID=A0A2S6N5C8_9HYPH|nr:hypothetical protein CCR94_14270 [Rhodoblastus sphagnicola]
MRFPFTARVAAREGARQEARALLCARDSPIEKAENPGRILRRAPAMARRREQFQDWDAQ